MHYSPKEFMRTPPSTSVPPTPPAIEPQSAPTRAETRARRRRTIYVLLAISIGWKVLVFTLGAAVPRWMIDDGVKALPEDQRPYALQAKAIATSLWSAPLERHGLVRSVRVTGVTRVTRGPRVACDSIGARVRAYTYFAIPYSEVRTTCDSGVIEYRVFRRRASRTAAATQ
jgi:hypothetical protein